MNAGEEGVGAGCAARPGCGPMLAVVLAGCAAQGAARPSRRRGVAPADGPAKPKKEGARYQRDLVMAELGVPIRC